MADHLKGVIKMEGNPPFHPLPYRNSAIHILRIFCLATYVSSIDFCQADCGIASFCKINEIFCGLM